MTAACAALDARLARAQIPTAPLNYWLTNGPSISEVFGGEATGGHSSPLQPQLAELDHRCRQLDAAGGSLGLSLDCQSSSAATPLFTAERAARPIAAAAPVLPRPPRSTRCRRRCRSTRGPGGRATLRCGATRSCRPSGAWPSNVLRGFAEHFEVSQDGIVRHRARHQLRPAEPLSVLHHTTARLEHVVDLQGGVTRHGGLRLRCVALAASEAPHGSPGRRVRPGCLPAAP